MVNSNKLSLYFNSKLIGKNLISINRESGYSTPVMYPSKEFNNQLNQMEVLIKTLKSFNKISFDVAILNIDIGSFNNGDCSNLNDIINNNINARILKVNFTRPSTPIEWQSSFKECFTLIGENVPTLIVMNHDHLFVDYEESYLKKIINEIFNTDNDFGKLLAYSHTPENISEAILKQSCTYTTFHASYKSKSTGKPSIYIMTIETLLGYLPTNITQENFYIGRLMDWDYPRIKKFKVKVFVPFRELFKHYDGYGHITSSKFITDLRTNESPNFKSFDNVNSEVLYYYNKWLDVNYLYLRDSLKKNNPFISKKMRIRRAIDFCFDVFKHNYIKYDLTSHNNILSDQLIENLYSYIYFNILDIYKEICNENEYMHNSLLNRIYNRFFLFFHNTNYR